MEITIFISGLSLGKYLKYSTFKFFQFKIYFMQIETSL
jgi:hypothetical protein